MRYDIPGRVSAAELSLNQQGRNTPYQDLISQITKSQETTNVQTKARETEVRSVLDEIIGMYRQGGTFGQGMEASLGREKTQSMAQGAQGLVSSGLYNTTGLAGLSGKFEEEVGAPTRMKLEDLRMDRLSGALGQKAKMVTDIENTQPDYRLLASLLAG